jgi:hypothetical protein
LLRSERVGEIKVILEVFAILEEAAIHFSITNLCSNQSQSTPYLERPNGLEQRKMVIFDKLTWRES